MESSSRIKDGIRGWHSRRMKYEGFGRIILRIFIICILKSMLKSTCVVFMELREVTTSEENRLGEIK